MPRSPEVSLERSSAIVKRVYEIKTLKLLVEETRRVAELPPWVHHAIFAEVARFKFNTSYRDFRSMVGNNKLPKNLHGWVACTAIWLKVKPEVRMKCRKITYYAYVRRHPKYGQWSETKCLEDILKTGGGKQKIYKYFSILSSLARYFASIDFTPENELEEAALAKAAYNAGKAASHLKALCRENDIPLPRARRAS